MTITLSRAADKTTALCSVVVFCLLLSFVLWVTTYRGLYADGSNLLLNAVELRNFYHVSQTRITSTFVTQLPLVLAIRFGVRSLAVLTMVYTAGLAIIPVACHSLSVWISRREPHLFCATIFVIVCCFYPVSFLLVGEVNVYLGLFWLAFVILLSENARGNLSYDVLLLVISIIALEVYETSAFFSAILALLSAHRANATASPAARFLILGASVIFVFGAMCGLLGILLPRDRQNESGFVDAIRRISRNEVYLRLLTITAICSLTAFVRRRWVRLVLQVALFAATVLFVSRQLQPSGQLALGYVMYQRAQVQCALIAVVSLLLLQEFVVRNQAWTDSMHPGILVVPLIGVLVIDTVDTTRWTGFIGRFCKEMMIDSGATHASFFTEGATKRYGVDWTFPTMSLVLGGKASRAILVEPGFNRWQPFDPRHAPDIHDFKNGQTICR